MPRRLTGTFVALLLVMTGFAGVAYSQAAEQTDTERIEVQALKDKLESGENFLLIDVREDFEIEEHGALKGAIHIPMGNLDARMEDIPKDIELVFY